MGETRKPTQIIKDLVTTWEGKPDQEVLAALRALPPLSDEDDPCWRDQGYWMAVAYPYLALADVVAVRRLRPAIELLLERACFGDPGEIMRGLRHNLEAIVDPEWNVLADLCLAAARSTRRGTRLWAIDELVVLDDPRAAPVFEEAARDESEAVRSLGEIGLERLAGLDEH